MDYTGRWKALQYYARRFYRDILVSPNEEDGNISVFVVSDRVQPTAAQLSLSLLDFEGNKLWGQEDEIQIAALNSKSYLRVPINTLLAGKDAKAVFLLSELLVDGKPVSSNLHFFQPYKDLNLPRPQIKTDVVPVRGGLKVTLSADKFARAVYLSAPAPASTGFFVDNYFDLIPGRKVEVEYRTAAKISPATLRNKLKIRSMADAF